MSECFRMVGHVANLTGHKVSHLCAKATVDHVSCVTSSTLSLHNFNYCSSLPSCKALKVHTKSFTPHPLEGM